MSTSKCARCGKNVTVTVMISEGKLELTSKHCVKCGKRPSLTTLKSYPKTLKS